MAQRQVEAKSNEIPAFTPLLAKLDLTNAVITADALHTQLDHAWQIAAAGGHYLFIVKGNQPMMRLSGSGSGAKCVTSLRRVISAWAAKDDLSEEVEVDAAVSAALERLDRGHVALHGARGERQG